MGRSIGLLACSALCATPASSEAKCAQVELGPVLITPATAKIPVNGGVLVGWTPAADGSAQGDPSVQKAWTASVGKRTVALAIETLAPGLSVYRPASPEAFSLDNGKQQLGTFARSAAAKTVLPAPVPTALTLDSRAGRYGSLEFSISATFASVPPAAVAVILVRVTGHTRTPLSFGTVGQRPIVVYDGPHRCAFPPPGTTLPDKTDSVALVWVDAFGRTSAQSAALQVTPSAAKP